jgi:hypothetical protein
MGARFKLLGAIVGCYVVYGPMTRAVYAKHRTWGRTLRRDEDTVEYWSAIAAYVVLAGALLLVF